MDGRPYGADYAGKMKAALRIQNDGAGGLFELLKAAFGVVVTVVQVHLPAACLGLARR